MKQACRDKTQSLVFFNNMIVLSYSYIIRRYTLTVVDGGHTAFTPVPQWPSYPTGLDPQTHRPVSRSQMAAESSPWHMRSEVQ